MTDRTYRTYRIVKHTSIRMDGTRDQIAILPEVFTNWSEATCYAMQLEAADRGKTYNGRSIQYDVQ